MMNPFKTKDRFEDENLLKSIRDEKNINPASIGVFFINNKVLFSKNLNHFKLPFLETISILNPTLVELHINPDLQTIFCEIQLTHENCLKEDYYLCDVKKALVQLDAEQHYPLIKSFHWLNWHKQSKYCGSCGKALQTNFQTIEKRCMDCNTLVFPRFSPAVIVLIYRDNEILLARSPHFPPGDYSAVAGFIEMGETAEQAAHREVKEELGIKIDQLEYFSSQTWPFPDSFMIAFKARFLSGELKIDTQELEDARWFTQETLPVLTPSVSIARKLIHDFFNGDNREQR